MSDKYFYVCVNQESCPEHGYIWRDLAEITYENNCLRFDIKEEYGSGFFEYFILMGEIKVFKFDLVFDDINIRMPIELSGTHYEIEYCIDGCVGIHDNIRNISTCINKDKVSVSILCELKGERTFCAGKIYRGVCIMIDESFIKEFFGHSGLNIWKNWGDRLENLGESRLYEGVNVSEAISDRFRKIFYSDIQIDSRKILYESLSMEILQRSIFYELLIKYENTKVDRIVELPILNSYKVNSDLHTVKAKKETYYALDELKRKSLYIAFKELENLDESIGDIAKSLGYDNSNGFCQDFRNTCGMTPFEYRLQHLNS